ncbi:MAG: T9SS type A sorting domain-containing protein [Bacteroidales bacterium]|nr:T9SS type A sorting domain-containing protein [Bacteroidales bacterium]
MINPTSLFNALAGTRKGPARLKVKNVKRILLIILVVSIGSKLFGQFAPAAGENGSTAIHKDDALFTGWAKTCKVQRGYINVSDTTVVFTQNNFTSNKAFFGTEAMATGKPGGALDCISLGDGGTAILTFDFPLRNGAGADFAVFENGMKMQESPFQYFLELAFVEVSTDGKRFVRFPAVSNTPASEQMASFGQIKPEHIHNFAGKYVANYGTPFDLEDIKDSTGINTDSINFVRLVDVVGNINPDYARYDSKGQVINDPFPTEFWSGGFDLDAVGVIHFNKLTCISSQEIQKEFKVWPNPVRHNDQLNITGNIFKSTKIELCTLTGKRLKTWVSDADSQTKVNLPELKPGLYLLLIHSEESAETIKLLVE